MLRQSNHFFLGLMYEIQFVFLLYKQTNQDRIHVESHSNFFFVMICVLTGSTLK